MEPMRRCMNCGHDADVHYDRAIIACTTWTVVNDTSYYRSTRNQHCGCPGYRESLP